PTDQAASRTRQRCPPEQGPVRKAQPTPPGRAAYPVPYQECRRHPKRHPGPEVLLSYSLTPRVHDTGRVAARAGNACKGPPAAKQIPEFCASTSIQRPLIKRAVVFSDRKST